MKYLVFVKVVGGELSPFDEAALETALRLNEAVPGEIIAVTMAPDSAADRMKALTRLGMRAVLLSDGAFAGSDTAATSYILAAAAKKLLCGEEKYLVLCGRQSMNGDTAQVGVSVAVRMGIPAVTNVMEIRAFSAESVACATRLGEESAALPALLTVERIAKLRFASMRARPREIERMNAAALGVNRAKCGLSGSPTKVLRSFTSERGRRFCTFLDADAFVDALLARMHEARAVRVSEPSPVKLREVYAVGEDVAAIAADIAERVVTLPRMEAADYAALFREKQPDTVLFPADLWGRRVAPAVATMLETGLCADCTRLETDGEKLFMYRPALGGSVTAMIECRTKPQMATVRTVTESAPLIVSCGLGVKEDVADAEALAKLLGGEPGASRGLVDAGFAPYEWQVGITGRTVAPAVYLAMGISGAVHHTAAIEGSGAIFGVNPDRGAPIFDFCDFGFVGTYAEFAAAIRQKLQK